jgi:membrane dipeptidase
MVTIRPLFNRRTDKKMTKSGLTLLVTAGLLLGCSQQNEASDADAANTKSSARELALNSVIIDTHIDVPYRLQEEYEDVTVATEGGDFDYPRAVAGGLNAAFMSIFTPAELEATGESYALAEELIDLVEGIVATAPEKFAIATSPADVRAHFEQGLVSLPLGMENGSPIEGDLAKLQHFYNRGIRYITLAHGLSNHISDSSYDTNRQWDGLSPFGAELIKEMNRIGVMIDVSHISDAAFWQTVDLSKVPVIASHSSARHFTPGFERNMSDEMIVRLGETGGLIMINYGSAFLSAAANEYSMGLWAASEAYAEEHPELDEFQAMNAFRAIYAEENGAYPFASLDTVLDHIDHAVKLAGVESVGIGSDYDGVGDSLPTGLKDVSSYPNLVRGLQERGYNDSDIKKILGENLLRVWQTVEDYADAQ